VVRDTEHVEVDIQDDIELALIQMKAEILVRIDEALVRLDEGAYGSCLTCDGEIAERRLRALPFAVRCQACEQKREQGAYRRRRQRRRPALRRVREARRRSHGHRGAHARRGDRVGAPRRRRRFPGSTWCALPPAGVDLKDRVLG